MATPRSLVSSPSAVKREISSVWATMPAPRPASSFSTRSKISTCQPRRLSMIAAKSPLIEPPTTSARRFLTMRIPAIRYFRILKGFLYCAYKLWRNAMALTMLDKSTDRSEKSAWPPTIAAEFERERQNNNGCVGTTLLSENDKVRVWIIRLAPGERIGFHRHVLDYFWTAVSGGRGRQHIHDGTTVEYTYVPGETRHETYGPGEFKVHDLENLGDKEMVFMTIEFLTAPISRSRSRTRCAPRRNVRSDACRAPRKRGTWYYGPRGRPRGYKHPVSRMATIMGQKGGSPHARAGAVWLSNDF